MKKSLKSAMLCGTTLLLSACASTPMGPTVQVMPQQGKPFDVFAQEQEYCKGYADNQVRGQADRANSTGALEGIGGTILGAGLGAAVGGGHGAAVGAAAGAIGGTAVGASTSGNEQRGIQTQYNNAYVQCMVAKGNQPEQRPVVHVAPPTTVIYQSPPPTVIYTAPPPPPPVVYQPAPPPY
jgi:outer membrane lipoprotein SlyB